MAQATNLNTNFAVKGDTETATFTAKASVLVALYVAEDNRYVYAVDDHNVIRKMSITRNVEHARQQYRIARKLVGKSVRFGVTSGWDSNVWFNEVIEA